MKYLRGFAHVSWLAMSFALLGCSGGDEPAGALQPPGEVTADGGLDAPEVDAPMEGAPDKDASKPPDASEPDAGGDAEVEASPEAGCIVQPGPDVPDDDFLDTNCDGFDGDISRGVFVAPNGSDGAAGTIQAPLLTITKAIAEAVKTKSDVYVCNGTYQENLVIQQVGVNLYGGYDCADNWTRKAEPAVVAPSSGIPLTVRDIPSDFRVYRMRFVAADATAPEESSIAALLVRAEKAVLERSELQAGNGAAGKNGAAPTASSGTPPKGASGEAQPLIDCTVSNPPAGCSGLTDAQGGRDQPPLGTGVCSIGGFGGKSRLKDASDCVSAAISGSTLPNLPAIQACQGCAYHESSGGWPGVLCTGASGLAGQQGGAAGGSALTPAKTGTDGAPGVTGLPGQRGYGTVGAQGYIGSNSGQDGTAGKPGQSGGGGAGGLSWSSWGFVAGGGGGQGGRGGCAGAGGNRGTAGGASVGLLLFESNVTVRRTVIQTAKGGRGGIGTLGASGQLGSNPGSGGNGTLSSSLTSGGKGGAAGGQGGYGGDGGSGAGGPSIGIFGKLSEVVPVELDVNHGIGGTGGSSAAVGGIKGADGTATDVLLLDAADEPAGGN